MPYLDPKTARLFSHLPEYSFRYDFEWDDISPEINKIYGPFLDNFDIDQHLMITAEYNPGEPAKLDGHPDSRHPGEGDEIDSLNTTLRLSLDDHVVISALSDEPLFAPHVIADMRTRIMNGEYPVRYVKMPGESVPDEYIDADFTCFGMIRFLGNAVMAWIDKNESKFYDLALEKCREMHAAAVLESKTHDDPDDLLDRMRDEEGGL